MKERNEWTIRWIRKNWFVFYLKKKRRCKRWEKFEFGIPYRFTLKKENSTNRFFQKILNCIFIFKFIALSNCVTYKNLFKWKYFDIYTWFSLLYRFGIFYISLSFWTQHAVSSDQNSHLRITSSPWKLQKWHQNEFLMFQRFISEFKFFWC